MGLVHPRPARSRAYRSGEDGIAGISDDQQFLCFALALWNGKDPAEVLQSGFDSIAMKIIRSY